MASQTTLVKKFVELQKAKPTHQTSHPKIQKVPEYLRNRNNLEKQYSPKSVSIGPIHHDNKNLKFGEKYKLTWVAKYIQSTPHTPESLHKKIADNIYELKALFTDDVLALANTAESLQDFNSLEEKLSWLLFVDGCFLLYLLVNVNKKGDQLDDSELVDIKVDQLDDLKDVNNNVDQLFLLVMMDVLLLENQLPYRVLKLLWKNDNENELIDTMENFLKNYHWTPRDKKPTGSIQEKLTDEPQRRPTHLLDLQRKMILTKSNPKIEDKSEANKNQSGKSQLMTYRNIEDLTAIGIKLKSSGTQRPTDVDFSEGWFSAKLTLPEILVDDNSPAFFQNLIAYEMCSDFNNDHGICSFAGFMDSLIDHAEDVKKLRKKGILANHLGRDEEVADLFNKLTTDLIYDNGRYFEVRAKIHKHRFNKCKIWLALGYHTYFSNPWAIIGFLAAFMALSLTCVQTWFSMFSR